MLRRLALRTTLLTIRPRHPLAAVIALAALVTAAFFRDTMNPLDAPVKGHPRCGNIRGPEAAARLRRHPRQPD
jgi:hypothetical protein